MAYQIDELQAFVGEPFKVNDYLTIYQPTVEQIIQYGEHKYNALLGVFTSTPSDKMSELDDQGINFMEITDYELFIMSLKSVISQYTLEETSILFGNFDFSQLELCLNPQNDSWVFSNDQETIVIDELAYLKIASYLRTIHHIRENHDTALNEGTRKIMIMLDRDEKAKFARSGQSNIKQKIKMILRFSRYSCPLETIKQMPIGMFNESAIGSQIAISSFALIQGQYSGFCDVKKINKKLFDWTRDDF